MVAQRFSYFTILVVIHWLGGCSSSEEEATDNVGSAGGTTQVGTGADATSGGATGTSTGTAAAGGTTTATTVAGCSTTCTSTGEAVVGTLCDDRDGQIYNCVIVNGTTWMAENLNYGAFVALNDELGADVSTRVMNDDTQIQRWCWDNDESLCLVWGALYPWSEAMNLPYSCQEAAGCTINSPHQGICPNGWHIPTQSEWKDLIDYAEDYDATVGAGDVLKSASLDFWQVEGYDYLNFTVIGAGGVYPSTPGGFGDRLRFANIWGAGEGTTESESDSTVILQSGTCFRTKGCNDNTTYCVTKGNHSGSVGAACAKRDGSSVRCVAD